MVPVPTSTEVQETTLAGSGMGSIAMPEPSAYSGKAGSAAQKKAIASAALWAMVLFAVFNLALSLNSSSAKRQSKDIWSGTGSIDLRIKALEELPGSPDVVLLGSSLIMYPFWATDKDADKTLPDIFHHHRSLTTEKLLAQKKHNPVVFNMSIFGSMTSDSYIYARELLKNERQPALLVIGAEPRGVYDHDLPSPMSTLTFKRMVGLDNFLDYANLYLPSFQDKAEFLLDNGLFLYGRRWRIQKELDKISAKIETSLLTNESNNKQETAPNADTAGFMLAGSKEERWSASTLEYSRRYKNISIEKAAPQLGFLSDLLDLCQSRKIKTILVDMPLSQSNRNLMPASFYQEYRRSLKRIANTGGAELLELGDSALFTDEDFWDTAHLNHSGGYKLIELVSSRAAEMLDKSN